MSGVKDQHHNNYDPEFTKNLIKQITMKKPE